MTDDPTTPLRREVLKASVERALEETWADSAKTAGAFLVSLAGIAALVGGGFAALSMFTGAMMVAFVLITLFGAGVSFFVLELVRLSKVSRLLRDVTYYDVDYASLLVEARRERDEAVSAREALETRMQLLVAGREVIGLIESADRKERRRKRGALKPAGDENE